jgi:hypothetical protein
MEILGFPQGHNLTDPLISHMYCQSFMNKLTETAILKE